VASNSLLRRELVARCGALFAEPEYSTDNAMGIAILANRAVEQGART
jgi:N6-L-threonylcarbamoyladenine synthase